MPAVVLPLALRRRRHQLGCARSVTDGSVTLDTSAAFALSRSATDTLATPVLVNHEALSDVQLQYATR